MSSIVKSAITGALYGSVQGFYYQRNLTGACLGAVEGAVLVGVQQPISDHLSRILENLIDRVIPDGPRRWASEYAARQSLSWGLLSAAQGSLTALTKRIELSALPMIAVSRFALGGSLGLAIGALVGFTGTWTRTVTTVAI